jgi:hypothetical protein
MNFSSALAFVLIAAPAVNAFTAAPVVNRGSALSASVFGGDIKASLDNMIQYSPGKADSDFARKYGHLAGAELRTVGEAFNQFTDILGTPVNALYKGICTDLVGSLHLIMVNARFERDAVFSLGLVSVLDLVLKNYPEQETAKKIKSAMLTSAGLDEAEIDAEAASLKSWAEGKTRDEIASALKGEGDSPLAGIANAAKGNQWWMYSRFFGIGLVKMMEMTGVEQDMSVAYDVMEEWMGKCMEKPHYTACSDSDLYFKQKGKLDMMETMMKEIEIREKKRMADRLEAKADMALAAAERAEQYKVVVAEEEAEKAEQKA